MSKANNETRKVKIIAEGKSAEASLKQLRAASAVLNSELQKLPRNSQAFKDKMKELQGVQADLRRTTQEVRNLDTASKRFWTGFKQTLGAVVGGNLITGFINKLQQIGQQAVRTKLELEEAMIDVRKVTGLTDQELEKLKKNISGINTRTSKKELMELAWAAGKLGTKGVDDITGFVKAANQIQVALGKDLGQDAIKEIGKMVSIFKLDDKFGLEEGMLKIASAVNEIGMASTAAEGYLVNFAKRMSGIAGIANLSAPDIVALAGTLDSLGQTAEVSSTALSKLFVKMGKEVEQFAKYAGMEVAEFSTLLREDALGALKQVLSGVGETAGGVEELSQTLGDLGLDGGRVVGVLGSLATNTAELTRQQEIANKAFKEGTSVTNEYNLKNQSAQASVEKLKKAIKSVLVNNVFTKGATDLLVWAGKMVEKTDELVRGFENERNELFRLQLNLNQTNISQKRRNEIIDELQKKYPDFIGNIDKEKVSNQELNQIIGEINKNLIKQIRIRELVVKSQESAAKAAAAETKMEELAERISHNMRVAVMDNKEINQEQIKGNDILEQALSLYHLLEKNGPSKQLDKMRKLIMEYGSAKEAVELWSFSMEELNKKADKLQSSLDPRADSNAFGPQLDKGSGFDPFFVPKKEDAEKSIKEIESLAKRIRDIQTQMIAEQRVRETKALEDKLADEIEAVNKSTAIASEKNELILLLQEKHLQDLAALNDKYDKQQLEEEYTKRIAALKEYEMSEELYYQKQFNQGIINAEEKNQRLIELEIEMYEHKLTLAENFGKEMTEIELAMEQAKTKLLKDVEAERRMNALVDAQLRVDGAREMTKKKLDAELELLKAQKEEELALWEGYEDRKLLIEQKYDELRRQKNEQFYSDLLMKVQMVYREIEGIYDSNIKIQNNQDQTYLNDFKSKKQQELDSLEKRYERGLISKEQYEKQKKKIDNEVSEEEKKIKLQQFEREQKAAITKAYINTALAVTKALAELPPPFNFLMAGLVATSGFKQVQAIRSQPVPQFAAGGRTTVKGQDDGRMYNANTVGTFSGGGVYSSPSVGLIGEKGAELVVPNWLYTAPSMIDTMQALESVIASKSTSTPVPMAQGSNSSDPEMKALIKQNMMMMAKLEKKLDNPLVAKMLWNETEYNQFQNIEHDAKDLSRL